MDRQRKRNGEGCQARRVQVNSSRQRKVRIEGDWAVRRGECGVVRKGGGHIGVGQEV